MRGQLYEPAFHVRHPKGSGCQREEMTTFPFGVAGVKKKSATGLAGLPIYGSNCRPCGVETEVWSALAALLHASYRTVFFA